METIRGVSLYYAPAALGKPVCVSAGDFNLNFYEDGDANIIGFIVYDDDANLLDAYGHLPIDVINEERTYLGREPIETPEFLPVTALGDES